MDLAGSSKQLISTILQKVTNVPFCSYNGKGFVISAIIFFCHKVVQPGLLSIPKEKLKVFFWHQMKHLFKSQEFINTFK